MSKQVTDAVARNVIKLITDALSSGADEDSQSMVDVVRQILQIIVDGHS